MTVNKNKPPIILVLGMHRSGTSLVAQMVAKWGAFMGDDLMQASEFNKDGYWEYNPLVNLHDKMLAYTGHTWYAPPISIDVPHLIDVFGNEARILINEMDNCQSYWCWKDPRLALFLPFWQEILKDRNLLFIISYRNPLSVADSLQTRDNIPTITATALWEIYSLKIFEVLKSFNVCFFAKYEKLIDKPDEQTKQLFDFLNTQLHEEKNSEFLHQMRKAIKPGLKHSLAPQSISIDKQQDELYVQLQQEKIPEIKQPYLQKRLKYALEITDLYHKGNHFKERNLQLQLFYKTTGGNYNETNSLIKKHEPGSPQIVFDFDDLTNITDLRFDPLNDWLQCSSDQLELYYNNELVNTLSAFAHNAIQLPNGTLFFATRDPQIYFKIDNYKEVIFNKVVVRLNYLKVGSECKIFFAENPGLFFGNLLSKNESPSTTDNSFSVLHRHIEEKMIHARNILCEHEIIQQKVHNLEVLVSQKAESHKTLETIVQTHTQTIQSLKKEKSNQKKSIEALNNEKKTLINEVKAKENRILQIQTELDKQNTTIEEQKNKYKELSQVLQNNEKRMQEERNRLEQELKNTNDTLNRLMANERNKLVLKYHWRLPLRLAGNLLHFIKHSMQYYRMRRDILVVRRSGLFDDAYYLEQNPDLYLTTVDLLQHYILYGWKEGRNPNSLFDAKYYLETYPDVKKAAINPLLHYVRFGKKESRLIRNKQFEALSIGKKIAIEPSIHSLKEDSLGLSNGIIDDFQRQVFEIQKSGMFDVDYYYSEYPDVNNAGYDAIEHYCTFGWKEGRNPSPTFETYYYLSAHKDVKELGMNPLLHYVLTGNQEGRQTQFVDQTNNNQLTFEKPVPFARNKTQSPVKTIAFYLPQFHPIPENDEWWGKGFTEWINVTKAKPQFEGHYQPHYPIDLGFYDLRIPDVMRQQVEMAKSFGINGFCFYYYWFGGKRLLEKPLDMFLEHKEWNFDFCLCWANENWTRRWDGQEKDVLIAQKHSPEDNIAFIDDIAKYILDPRYIKVDGKPMVIIYQPQIFPDIKATVKRWREHVKTNYGIEIYLTMVQTFGKFDPVEFDFDSAIEFPPHNIVPDKVSDLEFNVEFSGTVHDAKSIVKASKEKLSKVNYDLFRGVMLNWDNTARKGRKSNIFINNDPLSYKEWFEEAIEDTLKHKTDDSKKIVFINAWNEWAEGTHLEPDQKYGYAYLNATSRALEQCSAINNKLKIGVLIHAYYLDLLPELLFYANNIKENFSILLSVGIGKKDEAVSILKTHGVCDYIIKEVENIGFDIAPMLCAFHSEVFEFDLICKIHTKKSTHNDIDFGGDWRLFCLNYLLKDEVHVRKIINGFNTIDDLGIVYPPGYPSILDWIKKHGANMDQNAKILPETLVPISNKNLVWPIGSFFWFRPTALKPIFEEKFTLQDFTPKDFSLFDKNGIARDLTLAHSIERVFCYVARSSGFKTFQIANTLLDDKLAFPIVYHKKGFCPVCNSETIFFSPDDWYRDHLHCRNCNSIPRNRAIFNVLNSIDPNWKSKRIHESSPNNSYIADVVSDYTFSQFYPDEKLGKTIDGNRNENLEKLTFHNGEFDYFFTLDVLEHVFNPGIAIKEMLRVVNDNGAVVFTVPIHKHYEMSVQRAKLDKNNKTINLLPENYHGNPVGDGKSLVTWDYGQDFKYLVLDWIGKNFEISIFNEPYEQYGIIGDYLEVIVIKKKL
jgi:lipopolysaccharide biosynthesis protein/SAM-dependent methyltransferase